MSKSLYPLWTLDSEILKCLCPSLSPTPPSPTLSLPPSHRWKPAVSIWHEALQELLLEKWVPRKHMLSPITPCPPTHTHTHTHTHRKIFPNPRTRHLNWLFPQGKDPPSNLPGEYSRVAWRISFWEAESHAPPDLLSLPLSGMSYFLSSCGLRHSYNLAQLP